MRLLCAIKRRRDILALIHLSFDFISSDLRGALRYISHRLEAICHFGIVVGVLRGEGRWVDEREGEGVGSDARFSFDLIGSCQPVWGSIWILDTRLNYGVDTARF